MTILEEFKIWLNNNLSRKHWATQSEWDIFFAETERVGFWDNLMIYRGKGGWLPALNMRIAEVLNDFVTEKVIEQNINSLLWDINYKEKCNEGLRTELQQLKTSKNLLENELVRERQSHNTTKQNETYKTRKIEILEKKLNHQLSWKTKIKHIAIGSLLVWGSKETYNQYTMEKNNLSSFPISYNNFTWIDNVYLNIPFNKKEYKNLTNLLNLPQPYQSQKVNDILFSDFADNSFDWKSELIRLKISDLITQISLYKKESEKLITETKNKLNKAERYLLEKLLDENIASEKVTELKTALSDHEKEVEIILTKKQELSRLEKHLEKLQATQLEAKIEFRN